VKPRWQPIELVGDGVIVPCVDGVERPYLSLDGAASTSALPAVAQRVIEFLPWYSSVHRGAGYKSQIATHAYEQARESIMRFAGRADHDVAIICRNTTEAINHLAYRLGLTRDDTVVTTVVEHHANLLPWARLAQCRYIECGIDGTFSLDQVRTALDQSPRPRLLAITGASNVSGWLPPIDDIISIAHERGIPVALDAAQLAPHRPIPNTADFVSFSGHKMYAPFGAGVLIGPRTTFETGDPFLAGGGAVDLVDLDEVVWTAPPEREEAGSPNVIGAVALGVAADELSRIGWPAIIGHETEMSVRLREGLNNIRGVTLLGPRPATPTLAVAAFTVEGMTHALVAARLSAEFAIGVRHGCFCAHPYLTRLLGLSADEIAVFRADVLRGDRRSMPGAVRASACLSTTSADIERFLDALGTIASDQHPSVDYEQDPFSGDFHPLGDGAAWWTDPGSSRPGCSRS
jgi:selenocysteine lyase/cysteine desulfurase